MRLTRISFVALLPIIVTAVFIAMARVKAQSLPGTCGQ